MYEIYKFGEDLYQVHSTFGGNKSMEGSLLAILTHCVYNLGFDPDELQDALLDMINTEKDAANFGINRRFIYSFSRKEKYGRAS